MAYVFVGEITPDSVTYRQTVHSGGGRMSVPAVVAAFLGKLHGSRLEIEFKRGGGWLRKTVVIRSGLEVLAGSDPDLIRILKPNAVLTLRAIR